MATNKSKKIELGMLVRDRVTGFNGIAIQKCEYLTGCVQFAVKPQSLTKEGAPKDALWFDIDSLEYVGPGVGVRVEIPGGPTPGPLATRKAI
jgi:hypothetical protein